MLAMCTSFVIVDADVIIRIGIALPCKYFFNAVWTQRTSEKAPIFSILSGNAKYYILYSYFIEDNVHFG